MLVVLLLLSMVAVIIISSITIVIMTININNSINKIILVTFTIIIITTITITIITIIIANVTLSHETQSPEANAAVLPENRDKIPNVSKLKRLLTFQVYTGLNHLQQVRVFQFTP